MRLRKLKEKDIPLMLEWMRDAEINRFFRFDAAHATEQTAGDFIKKTRASPDEIHLACVNGQDDYLGTVSLKKIDAVRREAEYAVSFRRCAQGGGAAAFATGEILRVAFAGLGLQRVYLNVLAENGRAVRFYEKMGFLPMPSPQDDVEIRGRRAALRWFCLTEKEYEERRGKSENA